MWCENPDEAFDIRCRNLGCEDWCQDNSNCPIQRKDHDMFILVQKEISLKVTEESDIVIHISQDGKMFSVIKHRFFPADRGYPISQLKHILMAGKRK